MSAHFPAVVRFFAAADGGRLTPPQSGFRPQINIRGAHTSCFVESLDGHPSFAFGVEYRVALKLLHPGHFPAPFQSGDVVSLHEGNKCIGTATILDG